jgi:imidazolonepropionase-like amidohydrolase
MLSQAIIVDRGYAAPKTRQTLLRAKALISHSTSNTAALLKLDDRGVLVSGKLADMVVLDGRSNRQHQHSRNIHAVWHLGKKAAGPVEMFTP